MSLLYKPASNDDPGAIAWSRNQKILGWLNRLTQPELAFDTLGEGFDRQQKVPVGPDGGPLMSDDWLAVASICGHDVRDFIMAGAGLPLTAAEVEHFRRNHRGTENHVNRDFLTARTDLPSPLAELYGLYMHRARIDAEAVLFMAQATGTTRVARIMADLLAIGAFSNGLEYINYTGLTYSVPAAFDTSNIIDRVNHEAARRLALPSSHPAHLLKLTPDDLSMLAANMAEKNVIPAQEFLEKSNLLSEARQDVTRLPTSQQFATAIVERDLPLEKAWAVRICAAYARIFESWVSGIPEVTAGLQ
jgi:hypothetical protein